VQKEKEAIDKMGEVLALIENAQEQLKKDEKDKVEPLKRLDWLVESFALMHSRYPQQYRVFQLANLAMPLVFPLIRSLVNVYDPFRLPPFPAAFQPSMLARWKPLLSGEEELTRNDVFRLLLEDIVLPRLKTIISQWRVRQFDVMLKVLRDLKPLLTTEQYRLLLTQMILPKLRYEVDNWNPRQDTVPIDSWVHPWLTELPEEEMQPIYSAIRYKLGVVLTEWHPSDTSALTVIAPWQHVFREPDLQMFLTRAIIPKLGHSLARDFTVNPHQQYIDPFRWVMAWETLLDERIMINLLLQHFWPKWFRALYTWLNNTPNFEEYLGGIWDGNHNFPNG